MNWRQDPRIQRLLEKATLESLFKCYFQRVYGTEEITEVKNGLRNALVNYDKKDLLYENLLVNDENAAELFVNEFLDKICDKMYRCGQNHSPDTLLTLAKLFIKIHDHRLACELIWCSASLALQEFISDRQLKVSLYSHNGKRRFASAL